MHRYSRTEFFAFGLLPLVNVAALLIRGLYISTSSNYGEGKTIPILVVIAGLILLGSMVAAIKRAYDLDVSAKISVPVLIFSIGVIPLLPIIVVALCFMRGQPISTEENSFGPPPRAMNVIRWGWACVTLIIPWVLLFVLARVL
jgi:uncharacterized membrane protein YhaH (DUF805 family)